MYIYIYILCTFLIYIHCIIKWFKMVKLKEKMMEKADSALFLSLNAECMEQLFKDPEKKTAAGGLGKMRT